MQSSGRVLANLEECILKRAEPQGSSNVCREAIPNLLTTHLLIAKRFHSAVHPEDSFENFQDDSVLAFPVASNDGLPADP